MDFTLRRLSIQDLDAFRAMRLFSLEHEPAYYTSDHVTEGAKPESFFCDILDHGWIAGAFEGERLCGMGCLNTAVPGGQKAAHKGYIWGMYVSPESRGNGLARRIMTTLIANAQPYELLQLTVVAHNQAAIALYESLGFREYGREERCLKLEGRYYDRLLMAKMLR